MATFVTSGRPSRLPFTLCPDWLERPLNEAYTAMSVPAAVTFQIPRGFPSPS